MKDIQKESYQKLITHSIDNSSFYKELYKNIEQPELLRNIHLLPILDKERLRTNINDIYTVRKENAVVSKTGGTTGKSLEVYFTKDDMQQRFGMLDAFRGEHGYALGKKTAWFSGKAILTKRDIKKKRFWKMDYYHKVRYYSTFHIQEKTTLSYVKNLIKFKPEFIIGFPSSILDLANYGVANNIKYPKNSLKAVFPTAEQVDSHTKKTIEQFFNTKVYDQYASSEGAPFITECSHRNLHLDMQSGVFEVLDEQNNEAKEGRLVLTSFTTYGTPLIRYDIGDNLRLSSKNCTCGNQNPLVDEILGRSNDFIFSEEIGKINLGNLSNALKDVEGIRKFQVIQNSLDKVDVSIVVDEEFFSPKDHQKFLKNLKDRLGSKMDINISKVSEIHKEASGKYRLLKNNIKHLLP